MKAQQSDNSNSGILNRVFPRQIDNTFRGHWLGLFLFGFYALGKLGQGVDGIFNSYAVATGPDAIPLASYGAAAAQDLLSMFALLSLYVLVLPSLGVLSLIRYRSMIPLVCLFMLLLNFGSRAVHLLHPDTGDGGAQPRGYYVNLALLAVLALSFVLSLAKSTSPASHAATRIPGS